jgi:uncharacterized protein (TIGR02452 family)
MKTIQIASDTLDILERGHYKSPLGKTRDVATALKTAIDGTQLYLPEELECLGLPNVQHQTQITVTPESTLEAMQRLTQNGLQLAALNFASAKNPGGGFLRGAQAQEESLARSSGLYACLQNAPDFYQYHRHHADLRYSHRMIYSPNVPFFKNDNGDLLEMPYTASIITSAAPNYGALEKNQPQHLPSVPNVLAARAELVLRLAAQHQHRHLVLGAWGCGVFRNPPEWVAETFLELLNGRYKGVFESVVFAVYDRSKQQNVIGAFRQVFA